MTAASRFLVIILVVLGVLAIVAGIIYYVVAAKSLPTFFPGYSTHLKGRRTNRGLAGILLGVVLLIIAAISVRASRRSRAASA